jgi:hypothetical protein
MEMSLSTPVFFLLTLSALLELAPVTSWSWPIHLNNIIRIKTRTASSSSSTIKSSFRIFSSKDHTGSSRSIDEEKRDLTWKIDANKVQYDKYSNSFKSLEALGLNLSATFSQNTVIPYHIVGGNGKFFVL